MIRMFCACLGVSSKPMRFLCGTVILICKKLILLWIVNYSRNRQIKTKSTTRAVLTDYTNEPYFENRLQWVHKRVMKEITDGKKAVFVYCVDRLGRYASMALAKVLIECVKADPKLQLGRLSTISNLRFMDCGPCDRCCFWDHRFQNKVDACDRMRRKWLDWSTTPRPVEQ